MSLQKTSGYRSLYRSLSNLGLFEENDMLRVVLFDFDGVIFTLGGRSASNIDARFSELANKLKFNGIKIGGFTKRRGQLFRPAVISTFAQNCLKNFYALNKTGIKFDFLENTKVEFGPDSMLCNGVFFIGKKGHLSKGKALENILEEIVLEYGKIPDEIILIDDSQSNLHSVSKVCKKNNIDFQGMHYLASPHTVINSNIGRTKHLFEWLARRTVRMIGANEPEILDKILNN